MIFGSYLRKKRLLKNMTLDEVSTHIDASSRQFMSNLELGKNYCRDEPLKKIGLLLDIPYNEMICRKHLDKIQHDLPDISEETLENALKTLLQG